MTAAGRAVFPVTVMGCWQATRVTVLRYVTNFSGSPLRGIPEGVYQSVGELGCWELRTLRVGCNGGYCAGH